MKIKYLPIWAIKGATAYELQVWRFGVRVIHLKGKPFNVFNRISFQYFKPEKCNQ